MAAPEDKDFSSTAPTPRGKLTAEQARAIAECVATRERLTDVARRFGVSVETVGAIKSGKRWADAIDDELRVRMKAARPAAAVLDAEGARAVMAALEAGGSGRSIAEQFGISPSMVSAIKHGKAWAALDPGLATRLAEQPEQQRGKALTGAQVAQIKRQLLAGGSSRKIAAHCGVSASTVLAIARGETWADVSAGL